MVACRDLDRAIAAWQTIGFRLDAIGPADEPTWAELSRPGLTLVLDTAGSPGAPPTIRLPWTEGAARPGADDLGLEVELVPSSPTRPIVPNTVQSLAVSHEADGEWKDGRAGMRYRDLVPDRYGGAYIGSHIHVPTGGPVADYVHHHDVIHQLIFCHRGWVRVVYEDQGPPFVLRPGDCVLQPPGIRHRVLESSDDLFVVEIGCPAVHRTSVDHELELPNGEARPGRRYGGQLFVRHIAEHAPWVPSPESGGRQQDLGLGAATDGLVSARRVAVTETSTIELDGSHGGDLRLVFVTDGTATLFTPDGSSTALTEGSSATLPAGSGHRLVADPGATLLDITARDPQPG